MTIPVRASVYPAESGTVSGTGNYAPDDKVTLVWHPNAGYSQYTLIGYTPIGEHTIWFYITDEPLIARASILRSIPMPIQYVPYNQPLENGDTIIIFVEEYDCGRIEGNRQVAIGETFSLQFIITDGEEHRVQWWEVPLSGPSYMMYEGLTLSTVMNKTTLYLYLLIDPE